MQQHIEWLKEELQRCYDESRSGSYINVFREKILLSSIEHAQSLLEKEKEQIKEAYATGMLHPPKYCIDIDIVTNKQSEQYYNETYNPDQV